MFKTLDSKTEQIRTAASAAIHKMSSRRRLYYLTPTEIKRIVTAYAICEKSGEILNEIVDAQIQATAEFITEIAAENKLDRSKLDRQMIEIFEKHVYPVKNK